MPFRLVRRALVPLGLASAIGAVAAVASGALSPESAVNVVPLAFLGALSALELLAGRWKPSLGRLPRDLSLFVMSGMLDAAGRALAARASLLLGGEGYGPLRAVPLTISIPLAMAIADLVAYGVHRAFHAHAVLERMHALHHAPRELYALMSSVNAPLMVLLVRGLPMIALVACGAPPIVVVGYVVIDAWLGLASHTGVDTHNPWLSAILVTPEVHRLHHSNDPAHAGNYGLSFTLWDRIFGTFGPPRTGDRVPTPGPARPDDLPESWLAILFLRRRRPETSDGVRDLAGCERRRADRSH